MDFRGMKRKDLQTLCKKHGIPGNLKNIEMATRLASLFEKETVNFSEDSVEADGIKDNVVVSKEAKRVRFSLENEVFEFTRSVKNCQRKNVRMGHAQDLELRRSKQSVAKGITVAGANKNQSNTRRGGLSDIAKALEGPRRSKRIGSSGSTQEDCKVTELMALEQFEFEDISQGFEKIGRRSTRLKAKTLLPAKRSQRLADTKNKENELVKNNVKDISMDVQDDPKVEKVPRRIVNDIDVQTNTQDRRRSIRLKARAANSSMGGEASDGRPLCSAKESKKEIKTKQSKGSTVVNSQESELVKNKTKEPLIDYEVQTTENYRRRKVQDVSIVEKVPRRSKRLRKDNNVLMDKRPVKVVKREKSFSELLLDGQAQKGDKQTKRTFGNDREDKKLLRSSKLTALDHMSNSPKSCSVIDCERDGASGDNVKKSNVNDEMQVPVRNSSRHDSFEAPIVVEGNLVEKKTDETLEKKRDRSAEPGMDIETTSTQRNLTPKKLLDQYAQFEQEETGGTNVESGGSSKKPKLMNQECVKDMPQGMIENPPSSYEAKATESVMVIENVLDSTPEKSVDSSQRTNTQELNSELMEGKREEKIERDTILMPAIEEDKEEVSSRPVLLIEHLSPASVPLAISNPEASVSTGHTLVKDIGSTVIVEENTKIKEEIFICAPISELKEHSSVAKLANLEAILENSAECWKEIHPSKDDEKGSLETEVQAANLHGHFFEYNTVNHSEKEEMESTKNGYVSVGHCVNLTPEKLLDEYSQLEPEEAGGANVEARSSSMKMKTGNQEVVKDKPRGMAEMDSPSTSEKATEPVMISENVLDTTLKSSVDISPGANTEELNSELMEGEREEKHEQNTFQMAAIREKEEASSLSAFFIERSEVSNPEVELFVETTPPLVSVQLAVRNPEAELGAPTTQILVKDNASTVIANEEEILISIPRSELKEHSFVAKLAEAEEILENSAECWEEIHLSKDDEKGYLEKRIQAEDLHGNFTEYNTENSKVACISVGHSGNLESLDEVKDDSLEKTEQTISCESDCKLNELEIRRWSSTDFTSLSPKEDNVSKCFELDEIKALSQPLRRNKDVKVFDESAIFTTPERNLMLMERVIENGKTPAADSVIHQKDEAIESHVVVLTTPKQVLLLGDAGIDEAGKEEDDTSTDFPDESDVPNTIERYSMLEGSRQTEARNEGESKVIELHDESDIATSLVRKFSLGDFKGDRTGRNEENRTIELQRESGTCTSPERHELFGSFGQDKARESEGKKVVPFYEESGLSTRLHTEQPLANSEHSELGEAGWHKISSADKSGLFTSLETQLLYGDSEQKKEVKTVEKADAEFCDESVVPNIPERQPFTEDFELDEAAKNEEDKAVKLQVDCGIFTSAEKHLLLETDEEMKGDNMTINSHVAPDVIASESQSHMGEFEPDVDMNMDLLGESNTSTNLESHLLSGDSGLDETKKIKDHTTATCEESFVITSPERQQILVNSEPHSDGKEERDEVEFKDESAFFSRLESGLVLGESGQDQFNIGKSYLSQYQNHYSSSPKFDLKDDSMVRESHVAALGFIDNIIADSSGSMASKFSYNNHEFNVGQETAGAELMKKGSQAEDVVGLDATQGKSKKDSGHSPHVDPVNLFDFDIEEAETIMEAERNVSCSYLEVAGTCSMVSEESGSSTDVQNQIHDALEELAITDNNETNELIEAKVTKNIEKGYEGNLLLNSSGGREDEHLGFDSQVDFGNTCEKSGPKFLEDEAADSIATAFGKAMSLTSDELAAQNNMNENAADEEMIRRETTPSPEETLHESSENKEHLNIDESGTSFEKPVRREPILIYRTQVKLKRHDMKENAPNSKIVDNLNVTAPRTSKRQPLQDLRKN